MRRFATWSTGHRKTVILGWIVALIGIGMLAGSVGSAFTEEFKLPVLRLPGSLRPARNTASRRSPGDTATIVFKAPATGSNRRPSKRKMEGVFAEVDKFPHVSEVASPYEQRRARPRSATTARSPTRPSSSTSARQQARQGRTSRQVIDDRPGRRRATASRSSSAASRSRKRARKKATPRSRSACWRRSSSCCSPSARWSRWGCRSSPRCSRSASASAWSRSAPTSSTPPTSRRSWRR